MAKFHGMEYYSKKDKALKIYSYTIAIPKAIIEEVGMENCEVEFEIKNNQIIIKKGVIKNDE